MGVGGWVGGGGDEESAPTGALCAVTAIIITISCY